MDKGMHPSFSQQCWPHISQELLRYNPYFHSSQDYNALLSNCMELKIEDILRKNQNGFRRNRSTSQILTIRRILESVRAKNFETTILFVDFSKAFDSLHRRNVEQILLAYDLPKETVAAIIMLYKSTKVKVRSPNWDTDYFDIVVGLLLEDILSPIPVYHLPRLRA